MITLVLHSRQLMHAWSKTAPTGSLPNTTSYDLFQNMVEIESLGEVVHKINVL